MKKLILVAVAGALLSGCQTAEEHARQVLGNIDRSCHENHDMGYQNHEACLNAMANLYAATQAQRQADAERVGTALQNAGAALQSINPPQPTPAPPSTMQCQTFGDQTTCRQF